MEALATQAVARSTPVGGQPAGPYASGIDAFLQLLARALRQVQAYPLTSDVCTQAIAACRGALTRGQDVFLTLGPGGELVADPPVGDLPGVEEELARRLQRANVTTVAIQRDASDRDLKRFCAGLVRCAERGAASLSLAEVLHEDGITAIDVQVSRRPEVLMPGAPVTSVLDLLSHERRRQDEAAPLDARSHYLFPPHKGWVRLDPSAPDERLTLTDLAILVQDPRDLAVMLSRLAEDELPDENDAAAPLARRLADVATLFAALDPRLSAVMFEKLGRALLAMDPAPRNQLVRRIVLPAVFDGRPAARILPALPDIDLAEALCLLLDGETAAPALVISALDQLGLDSSRRAALLPLVDDLIQRRRTGEGGLDQHTEQELSRQARRLTHISAETGRSFAEFAAFDLTLDESAVNEMARVRQDIGATDPVLVVLACLTNLLRIQPNPEVAAPFARDLVNRCAELGSPEHLPSLVNVLERLDDVARHVRERRPEIAQLITESIAAVVTPRVAAAAAADLAEHPDRHEPAIRVARVAGPAFLQSALALLAEPGTDTSAVDAVLAHTAVEQAALMAEALDSASAGLTHHLVRALGHAGPGHESVVDGAMDRDERSLREGLRALARIGTPDAAERVARRATSDTDWVAAAAVEALLRFSPEQGSGAIRGLLAQRGFVLRHPDRVLRILERVARTSRHDLDDELRSIAGMRFRVWNRPVVRAARRAQALLAS